MIYETEINPAPSVATFQPITDESCRTRMTENEMKNIPTNGHNLQSLRDFSTISRHDKIDQIGIATKLLAESASNFSKSGLRSALMKSFQSSKKPN